MEQQNNFVPATTRYRDEIENDQLLYDQLNNIPDPVEPEQGEQQTQEQPAQPTQQQQEQPKEEKEKGFFDESEASESLSGLPDVVSGTLRTVGMAGAGAIDTVSDVSSFLVPWLKPVDDWWEEVSMRKETTGYDKMVREIGGFLIPGLGVGGTATKIGVGVARKLGFTGLTKGLPALLGRAAATEGAMVGMEAMMDQSKEAGNLSSLLDEYLGLQTGWATKESDSEDVIYKNNMYEAAALGGVATVVDLALSRYSPLSKIVPKILTTVVPKNAASKAAIESSSYAERLTEKYAKSSGIDSYARREATEVLTDAAQTEEAIKRLDQRDPTQPAQYDAFVNEPHSPPDRAIQDADADPIAFKVGNAKIQNNTGTVNGRPRPAVTDHFKNKFIEAPDGSDRGKLLDEVAEGLEPSFDVVVGTKRISAEEVDESIDRLVYTAFNEPDNFVDEIKNLRTATDDIMGNKVTYMSEDGFKVTTEAFDKIFNILDPNQRRASAVLVTQAAGNVSDAARAVDGIGAKFNTARQQEMAFNALKILMPEIRANQFISGKKLQLKNLVDERKAKGLTMDAKWFNDASEEFEIKLRQAKEETLEFVNTAVDVSRQNPEYFKPLMREFVKSNGNVDSIDKLAKLAQARIGFWKKAFVDGEPQVPSMLVQQLQSTRYNHVLTGLAPVRASAGAFTALIGKPVTTFVGAAATGDIAAFKRATYVFGGVAENLKRAFSVMADEWKFALENPDEAMMRGRKDFQNNYAENILSMDEMAEAWRKNGENGKVAVWNMTKLLSSYNKNPIVRFGLNSMGAIDGFTKSMSASMSANARAYDELFESTKGSFTPADFQKLSTQVYGEAFDRNGILTDKAAQFASSEINLNMDSKLVSGLETMMQNMPILKSIFMFPRTGVNAINLVQTFAPTGVLGQSIGRGRKVLRAKTQLEIDDALVSHGFEPGNNAAFQALKSEYIGRQMMGGSVVMGAALWAAQGNLHGSGPQDEAEKRRLIEMGVLKPFHFRDLNGEWRSYQGLEPFDTFLGLVADVVYQGQRMDQAITEDWFRAIAHSITMNVSNKTFLSGFEPLARLTSGDPSAMSRFFAMQADSYVPGTGIRSILSKAITPQLKDVENNAFEYFKNRNKFITGNDLADEVDVYTGEPINYMDPLTAAVNSVLPFFKTNGGSEEWRQKLLASGWDNLQAVRTNPISGQPLTPDQRKFVNTWVGKNYKLGEKVEELMNQKDAWWGKELKKYAKARGLKTQAEYPIKATLLHELLDEMHQQAYDQAWAAMRTENSSLYTQGILQQAVKDQIRSGNYKGAENNVEKIRRFANE